ncbi:MAG: chemotaxis response regulator protein-glutamate methylesterase [Pseudanabaena frigida]|uniref:Protein-glutamate methylesterase/protein-glutamine glutaminase n=1 Tax=Pseudanabaena frigida TaxID=945775 RepID=A0A2W4WG08_9CYAN|nr:MAG: chemotaxis response regulator protein-glutamate methylesterase [Pseudanabaena frigida]
MRIAIVNDTAMAVEALKRVLLNVSSYQVVWVARDGAEAVACCAKDKPDLILMDLFMPIMDGVEATRQIMKQSPCMILIVTASVGKNAGKVFEAMGYGARDAVDTPILGIQGIPDSAQPLLAKIVTLSKLIGRSSTNSTLTSKPQTSTLNSRLQTSKFTTFTTPSLKFPSLIAIGSSTGGPKALATILSRLPANFGAAIAIVQHVDMQFSAGLVDWLNQQTPLTVRLAKTGDRLEKGIVHVAGTNDHLSLRADLTLHYIKEPIDYPYRPSVDVFFKSLSQHWNQKEIAVLLTGMGQDGAEGLKVLRSRGWHTIAQDEKSCIVYGMPKAAAQLNAAMEILSPDAIAQSLIQRVG